MDGGFVKAVRPAPARPGTRLTVPSLRQCQIDTPSGIVRFAWGQIHKRRPLVGAVLDLGAGNGTFAAHGRYKSYTGYELDVTRIPSFATTSFRVLHSDALDALGNFEVVI